MKKALLAVILCAAFIIPAPAQEEGASEAEMKAIEKAAFDYVDGVLSGDAARVENALHPEVHKLFIMALPSGREITSPTTRSVLIEGSAAGMFNLPDEERVVKVKILDVYKNVATVRVDSPQYVDYIHIGKINGEWKVFNVLWAPTGKE